ncbi:MAG: RluA family pseudouridine synthase [Deltaproteobacteria bacterium]|nr:RluA family pseudouridine synthase [Deltaproteobacteria bacterium]
MATDRTFVFTVAPGDPVQRLDTLVVALLAREGASASRSSVQQWIEHGRVLIDGQPAARTGARVRAGAVLSVQPEAPPLTEAVADASVLLSVMYEDDDLIVIDKPAGLVVHPARGHATGTLVNGLLARGSFDQAPIDDRDPEGKRRPGIVHRLDKDTSGVLVVARTVQAREGLKALFARHDIDREYKAVVVGQARDGTYDTMIGRHPTDRLKFTTRTSGEGRRAVTHVRVLERLQSGTTLVACRLETGRTHQIRVHLCEWGGTPVLGDALYGTRPRDPFVAAVAKQLGRQWLHAALLGFKHPVTGKAMCFESPLPAELEASLQKLREA